MADNEDNATYQRAHWDDDQGPAITVVSSVLLSLAALAVVMRLAVHKFGNRGKLGWDDILLVLALVSGI